MRSGSAPYQGISLEFLTLSYLFIPHLQFCIGWLEPLVAWPMLLLFLWGARQLFIGKEAVPVLSPILSGKRLWLLLLFASLVTIGSGIGGVSYQRGDYEKHHLISHDLIHNTWPVVTEDCNGISYFLSYYLGYYLPPAGMASLIDVHGIEGFTFFWGWLGICLALIWIQRLVPSRPIWAMGIFICFGGLDVCENIFRELDVFWSGTPLPYPMSLIVDCQLPEEWGLGHNYPSHMSQVGWAPQHAICCWLLSAWCFYEVIDKKRVCHLGYLLSLSLFWSPFVFLGLLALVGIAVLRAGIRPALTWHSLLPPLLWLGIMMAYYAAHPPLAYNGFVWEYAAKPAWGWSLVYFALGEYGLYLGLMWFIERHYRILGKDRFWIVAIGCLLTAILFYRIGRYNDLALRMSGPPIFWMCICMIRMLCAIPYESVRKSGLKFILIMALAIGSIIPLQEIGKNLLYPLAQISPTWVDKLPSFLPGRPFIVHTLTRKGAAFEDLTEQSSIRDIESPCQEGEKLAEDALFWQYMGDLDAWYYRVLSK